jgi:alkylation response protein AidB-like acyl-CoA dehydrogenase
MDVRFSGEQLALRDSAARVVDQLGPRTVAQLDDAERRAKLHAAVAGAGWRELRAADDDHKPWASAVEVVIVAEELGRGLADTPLLGPTLAADLRRRAGVPPSTEAETIALQADLSAPGDAVAIDAAGATAALVLAGDALHTVPVSPRPSVDLTRPSARPNTAVSTDLGGHITAADLDAWTALGLALTCADLVGTMRGAIKLATEYATARRQYGVPVGSFQAVQHLLADAFVAMEGSASVALHAAWAVDALAPSEALGAAATAKAYCSRAARSVCETAIQVHGGIGNTWDCLAHVYLRRALLSIDILGGVGPSLTRVLTDGLR